MTVVRFNINFCETLMSITLIFVSWNWNQSTVLIKEIETDQCGEYNWVQLHKSYTISHTEQFEVPWKFKIVNRRPISFFEHLILSLFVCYSTFTLHWNGPGTGTGKKTGTIGDHRTSSCPCLRPEWTFLYNILGSINPVPGSWSLFLSVPISH